LVHQQRLALAPVFVPNVPQPRPFMPTPPFAYACHVPFAYPHPVVPRLLPVEPIPLSNPFSAPSIGDHAETHSKSWNSINPLGFYTLLQIPH
jgi:hypothetical protein